MHFDDGFRFPGFYFWRDYLIVPDTKMKKHKDKIRQATRRQQGNNLEEMLKKLNEIVRGFGNYFSIENVKFVKKCRFLQPSGEENRSVQKEAAVQEVQENSGLAIKKCGRFGNLAASFSQIFPFKIWLDVLLVLFGLLKIKNLDGFTLSIS